jgi:adenylate cyclase
MRLYHFKTLRARLTALLVVPVLLILLVAGISGFIFARGVMLDQWNESVMLNLERAAHEIDTRLLRPVELMKMFSQSGTDFPGADLLEVFVHKLETLPGVVRVNIGWHSPSSNGRSRGGTPNVMGDGRFIRFHRGAFTKIAPPKIDEHLGAQTVSVTMVLMDAYDTPVGSLEIIIRFDYLMADITANVWWQKAMACIADRASGRIMLSSGTMQGREKLAEADDPLEGKLLKAIHQDNAGTIWGPGMPPERIAGFHSLDTFPWALVVFADGKTILAPIINFRNGFILGALALVLLIYGIIRLNVDRMSGTIRNLSERAVTVAAGEYEEKIVVESHDEIGKLAISFNTMIDGLRERDTIRNTFGRYVDPDFARALLKQPDAGRLGGRRQEVAILMADIIGFTPMAEHLSPEETLDALNRYFSAIIPLVQGHRGIIVDFIGDAILAFFEPVDQSIEATVYRCVQCAFDMQAAMRKLNRELAELDLPALKMGIGVHSGPVVVGNIGSLTRKKYGIVGASVNMTQRIQGQAEAGETVVSQPVIDKVGTRVSVARSFPAALKGVSTRMKLTAIHPGEKTHYRLRGNPVAENRTLWLHTAIISSVKAGRAILDVYDSTNMVVEKKADNSPLTLADRRSHDIIMADIDVFGIPVLSEEGRNIPFAEREQWPRMWIVDPLDGTKEFIKRNGEFTVNIALAEGGVPTMGVIYVPVTDTLYFADREQGAFKIDGCKKGGIDDGKPGGSAMESRLKHAVRLPLQQAKDRPFTIIGSRSHATPELEAYVERMRNQYGEVDFMSSGSSLKICLVAEGRADIYPRLGPTMEWDTAAGQAIVVASGAQVVRHDNGKALTYNKEDLLNPWFIVQRKNA